MYIETHLAPPLPWLTVPWFRLDLGVMLGHQDPLTINGEPRPLGFRHRISGTITMIPEIHAPRGNDLH